MASLTKITTALLVSKLVSENYASFEEIVVVPHIAEFTPGTSAFL